MFEINIGIIHAQYIVALLQRDQQLRIKLQEKQKILLIDSYQNGREQGLIVWGFRKHIGYYICEGRRTDSIVIYKGELAMQGISENAYANSEYFDQNNAFGAYKWLVNDIISEL